MKTYQMVWRNKFMTLDAKNIEDMLDKIRKAGHRLEAMVQDGCVLEGGQEDDYARITTTDPAVAKKYGMTEDIDGLPVDVELEDHEDGQSLDLDPYDPEYVGLG